jgi:N-acyl-phosphatidylethanolamine-hydrolysing phospholipase D
VTGLTPAGGDLAHHAPNGFRNPWPRAEPRGVSGLVRWGWERLRRGRPPDPDPSIFPRANPSPAEPRAPAGELRLTWVGHSTVLIQMGGANVLTDPIWSERASPLRIAGPRRWVPPGLPLDALPPVDLILLSHNHYDHFDAPTIRRLARAHPSAIWCVPLGLGRPVRALGATEVREHDWWEHTVFTGREWAVDLGCTPAQHFSARGPFDRNRTLWCGWALRVTRGGLFFAGDTGYHPEFGRIAERFGPFHAVLLPVGAYLPSWMMRPVHLDPEEALHAYADLCRGTTTPVLVPIHWGTFKLSDEPMDEPPARTLAGWMARGLLRDRLWLMAHGETRALSVQDRPPSPS